MSRWLLLALLLTACGGEADTLHRAPADAGNPCDECSYDPDHEGTYRCAWGDWPQFYACKAAEQQP